MSSHLLLRKPAILFIVFLLLTLSFTGCANTNADPTREVSISNVQIATITPTPPYAFVKSDPGYTTLHGMMVVLDPISMVPAQDDGIYLVPMSADQPISGIPQFEIGKVPQAEVDEISGEFTFTNIEPGQYAVVVLTEGGSQIPVRYSESGNYAIITVDASQKDTTVDMGYLTLP